MTEIICISIGLAIGIMVGMSADALGLFNAKTMYDKTIAHKNKTIDDLLNQIDDLKKQPWDNKERSGYNIDKLGKSGL